MKENCYIKSIPSIDEPLCYFEKNFINSEFVEIVSNDYIDVQLQYPLMGMKNAEQSCLLRKEVYERLLDAAKKLPKGYKIRILDAWRPFGLQEELYDKYSREIILAQGLESVSEEERNAVIRKYISEPKMDRTFPPVHTTGGAVDVTLLDCEGNELNMGTEFDSFSDETHTAFFEMEGSVEIRNNRRLLYNVMISAGFTNLPSEWWHYDYGNRFWAYYLQKPSLYRGVFTLEEMYEKN